ncbi:hypothetical protein C9374_013235 [Naegleria lovaniensis]|uniref:RWD domain-containing protein n=1 Tax=Naegleria lovaniensis TaxID=51637 RepID=A0AA88KV73_NAELO|nr:uncharacterized protein C9374_013235 [Naegleria lovaniensis]KAG2391750.1 hypothetical protein C9374_013235 [Naegleria lovaniensis]
MNTSSNNNNNNRQHSARNEESTKFSLRQVQGVNDLSIDASGELMALGSRNGLLVFRLPTPSSNNSSLSSSNLSSSLTSTNSQFSSVTSTTVNTSSQPTLLLQKSKKNEVLSVQFGHDFNRPLLACSIGDVLQIWDTTRFLSSSTLHSPMSSNSSLSSISSATIAGGSSGVRGRTSSNSQFINSSGGVLGSSLTSTGGFLNNQPTLTAEVEQNRSFQAHQRSINAISWCPHDASYSKIATCSGDGYVNIWDTRLPSTQCKVASFISYTDIPSLVAWNPIDSHIIASAHNVDVRIWDIRTCTSSTTPTNKFLTFISAHHPLISSMDWSPTSATELVTAGSQDKFIKVWDYEQHQTIMSQRVAFPVWKIKYTPFGKGLVSISKKDNQVRVWRLNHPQGGSTNHIPKESPSTSSASTIEPIENISIFSGHTDEIKCLDFRTIENNNQHQLVTWSKDLSIRFWNFTQQIIEDLTSNADGLTSASNSKDNNSSSLDKNFIPSRSPIGMMSLHLLGNEWSITSIPDHIFETDPSALFDQTVIGSPVTRLTFDHEIEKIISVFNNLKFCTRVKANQNEKSENIECETKLNLEKMDKSEQARYCILGIIMIIRAASSPNLPVAINDLKLKITFPKLYPINAAPSFDFLPSRSFISVQDLKTIKQALTSAAHDDVLKHHNCMLSCFRSLVSILGKMKWRERRENEQDSITTIGMNAFNSPSSLGMPKVLSSANLVATNFSKTFDEEVNDKQQSSENTSDNIVNLLKDKPVSQDEHTYIAHPISGARFSPSGDLIYFNSCSLRNRKSREDISNKNDKKKNDVDFGYRYYLDMVQELKTPFSLSIKSRSKEHGDETQEKRRKKSTKKDKKYLKNAMTNSMNSSINEAMTISQDLSNNSDMKHDGSDLIDGIKDIDKEQDNNYFSSVYNDYHDDSTEEDSYYSAEFDDDSSEEGHTSYYSNHGYMGEEEHAEESNNFSADQKRHIFFNDTRTDPRIHTYDIKHLLPVSYSLAQKYRVIGNSAVDVCLCNSQICLEEGKHDLAKMWKILSLILDPRLFYDRTKSNSVKPSAVWSNHALGRRFVKKLLSHFLSKHDIQTCAIISCILQLSYQLVSSEIASSSQPTNVILNSHLNFDVGPKSRPWDFIPITPNNSEMSKENIELIASTDLLEKELKPVMAHVRLCYAKLLQSWGLHLQRCEIMKYNESNQAARRFMNGTSECVIDVETTSVSPATIANSDNSGGIRRSNSTTSSTTTPLQSPLTPHQPQNSSGVLNPKKSFLHCSLCRIPVKGLVSYCPNCNHGGHVEHIQNWFKSHETCPAGCNCKCSSYMVFYPVSSPTPPGHVKSLSVSTSITNGNAISAVNVDRTPEHSSTFSIKKQSVTPNPQRNEIGGINSVLSFLNL